VPVVVSPQKVAFETRTTIINGQEALLLGPRAGSWPFLGILSLLTVWYVVSL
jgi:hypothetical protein